jgi:HEAT repeat protein
MKLAAAAVSLLVAACAHERGVSLARDERKSDTEVETQLALAESPFGDGPHRRERERAAQWLLEHADRSYPVVLRRLEQGSAGAALVELLPRFDREESIPRLERLLSGPEPPAWAAGQALARQSQPAAGEALRRVLDDADPKVAAIAADGLGTRGDRGDCAALVAHVDSPDARLRYHVVQAAGRLGCLAPADLESLSRADADADVRALAARLLAAKR